MKVNKVKHAIIAAFVAVFAFVAPAVAADIVLPNGIDTSSYQENNTVYDGTTYYPTLQKAVEAVCGTAGATLYCKPGADVGSLQHAPVTATLTIYGNGAYVSGGNERDFDIGNTDPNGPGAGKVITADMTLTVKGLNGCGAWGNKATEHTVNLVFEDCQNMGKVFITGTTGTLNITIKDSTFEGVIKEAVYSNADGAITLTNVDFSNLTKAVNLNHKATGTQMVTITDCSFTDCGANVASDQIPVRVLSSVEGGKSVLTVSGTTFTGTPEGGADILLDYGIGETTANISTADTAANVVVEKTANVGTTTIIPANTQNQSFVTVERVALIGDTKYKTLYDAVKASTVNDTITLLQDAELAFIDDPMYNIFNAKELDLNGKTLTIKDGNLRFSTCTIKNGNIVVGAADYSGNGVFYMFDDKVLTLDNVKLTAENFTGYSIFCMEGNSDLVLQNGTEITVKNANLYGIVAAVSEGEVTIDNAKITGETITGRGFLNGNYTIKGTSEITLTGVTKDGFYIGAGDTLNIQDTSKVDITLNADGDNRYGINISTATSIYTKAGTATVNATLYAPPVAKIGTAEYTTLAAAVAEATEGQTITLISDVTLTETLTIPAGKIVTLDLNGKTVSHTDEANKYAINNLGTLTLKDSKGNGSINARGIYNGYGNGGDNVATAKITVESGTYNAKGTNGGAAIFNYGIAEIKGGSFTSIGGYSLNNQASSSMTIADGVTANNGIYCSNAKVTVNGGNISGNRSGCHVVYAWNSELTINGGTFYNNNSGNATIMSAGTTKCTITGGTFGIKDGRVEGNGNTFTSCLTDTANTATMAVTGGTFNGGFRVQAGTTMTIEGGSYNDCYGSKYNIHGTVTVKGGTFTDDTAKTFAANNLADGYKLGENGQVVEDPKNIEVTDANGNVTYYAGFTGFSDLDLADCTIKLLNNVSDANLILNKGSSSKIVDTNVTLDLNGYTFRRTGSSSGAISLTQGSGLTILDSSDAKTGKILVDTYAVWMMNGDFVLESGTIETTSTKNAAIYANAAEVAINDGKIISAGDAITVGENFMESRGASNIAISGGEIVAAGVGIKNGGYAQGSTAVTVTGGKIDSDDDSISFTTGSVQVSGGTFSSDVSDYCVDGYESKQNADGTYGVVINPAYGKVAKIGDNYYETLSAAFAVVTDDAQTVTILKDVTEELTGAYLRGNITTENDAKVTITLTNNSDWVYCPYTFVLGANVTLKCPNLFYYAGGTQINGTLIVGAYYQRYAGTKLTINEPGSMTVTGETFILRYTDGDANAGIYINGDNNDETIGLKLAVAYFYQGMISAKDANLQVGTYWQTNETDGQGSANLVLDNSSLNVTVNDHNMKATGNSTVTLKNGSSVEVARGYEGAAVKMDATSNFTKNGNPVFVAKIGDEYYATLQAAIDAAGEGDTITLLVDVTVTTPAYGQNALNHARNVNFTLDLNGKTLTADTGNSVFRFNITGSGATSNVTITVKNGKVVAGSNTWCALMAAGISADVKAVMNLEDLTVEASKAGDLAIKAWANGVVNASNVTVNATNGAGGFYALGGEIVLDDCTVVQKGLHTEPYLSMAVAVSNGGKATVNSGTYSAAPTDAAEGYNQGTTHGSWCAGVMNSGGTLIINGGTFSNDNFGDNNLSTSARGLIFGDTASVIRVNGGTFNALKTIFDYQNNLGVQPNPDIMIAGGVYSADPMVETSYGAVSLADGYAALKNFDNKYVVGVAPTAEVENLGATTVAAGGYTVVTPFGGSNSTSDPMELPFVMKYVAVETPAAGAASPYADWYGDFVITFSGLKNGSISGAGCYLAGHYGTFGWVKVPVDNLTIENGVRYPVMLSTLGNGQKYDYICSGVDTFLCAMYLPESVLAENPDLKVSLELCVVDNANGPEAAQQALATPNSAYTYQSAVKEFQKDEFVIASYVAQIGETKFTSLKAAIDAAVDGDTITVVADVTLAETLTIPEGKTITLDLNGKTINGAFNGSSTTNHIYALNNYGTLTITDTSAEQDGAINSRGIYNYGSLTLNAGKIAAIDGNGGYAVNNEPNSIFVMNGGWLAADYEDGDAPEAGNYDATALDVPTGCTATLNGGKITNAGNFTFAIAVAGTLNIPETSTITVEGRHGAIAVSGGTTTINAGTFTILANTENTDNVLYISGGELIINGGTFTGDSDTASGGSCLYDEAGKATINGGTFSGSSGGDVWGTTGTTIKGGTFENLTETQHIADGFFVKQNSAGKYVVIPRLFIKMVGNEPRIGAKVNKLTLVAKVNLEDANWSTSETKSTTDSADSDGFFWIKPQLKDGSDNAYRFFKLAE